MRRPAVLAQLRSLCLNSSIMTFLKNPVYQWSGVGFAPRAQTVLNENHAMTLPQK